MIKNNLTRLDQYFKAVEMKLCFVTKLLDLTVLYWYGTVLVRYGEGLGW